VKPVDLVVAIPAHDEAAFIAGGLGGQLADLATVARRPLRDAATEVLSPAGGS